MEGRMTQNDTYPIRGRFSDDDERRRVLLERERPPLSPAEQLADLRAQTAALRIDYEHFMALKAAQDEIALFLREHYQDEIQRKEPQHAAGVETAALFYMRRERKLPRLLRWFVDTIL